ncbi:uncharacterized protein LOC122810071 [Protopterus annectens]|uniref:uncharacterized protein LOC122810071 n=1 Tax=Protopterus annectens TaxID=7888 RepID=UPI001CFB381F|nr:uncharacterized protein LOC122810071 [Protopterus annectens]
MSETSSLSESSLSDTEKITDVELQKPQSKSYKKKANNLYDEESNQMTDKEMDNSGSMKEEDSKKGDLEEQRLSDTTNQESSNVLEKEQLNLPAEGEDMKKDENIAKKEAQNLPEEKNDQQRSETLFPDNDQPKQINLNTGETQQKKSNQSKPESTAVKQDNPEIKAIKQNEPKIKQSESESKTFRQNNPESEAVKKNEPEIKTIKQSESESKAVKENPESKAIKQNNPDSKTDKQDEQNVLKDLNNDDGHIYDSSGNTSLRHTRRAHSQMKYKTAEELVKNELSKIKHSFRATSSRHFLNRPKREPYHPFVWNSLSPYSNTQSLEYLLDSPFIIGPYRNRLTATDIVDPEVSWRMDKTIVPQFYLGPKSQKVDKTSSNESNEALRSTTSAAVRKEREKYLSERKSMLPDVHVKDNTHNNYTKQSKKMGKHPATQIMIDYQRSQGNVFKMDLDKVLTDYSGLPGSLRVAYRTYTGFRKRTVQGH